MTCRQCGLEVPAGARFCPSCGAAIADAGGDERRMVTVLFADIVGFTTLSETLDPEYVKTLVDGWFEHLVADIADFGGRVDKIIGDGILALFGAPVAHEDDAERAVRCGLRMQETLASVAVRPETGGASRVQMRIGINTGEVLVGTLRADGAITAMGDVVNTASRLQTAARPNEVLVGPATYAQTAHALAFEPRGSLTARGREAPVEAWSATGALLPPGQRPTRDQAPLVGRQREIGLIDAATVAAFGHSRALLAVVVGDTGVGKTRLTREATSRIGASREVVVLEGRCVPYGEANVWWPLAEALHGLCEIEPTAPAAEVHDAVWARVASALGDEADDADLDTMTRGLLVLMGHAATVGSTDPVRARHAAVEAFIAFVEAHARRRPVFLLLSDLHWADPELLGLVERLVEQLARCPVIVMATARSSVRERWNPPMGRFDTLAINLDPLDPAAAGELLDELHGSTLPAGLRDDLLARSGGNPFFLEELVALVDAGSPDPTLRLALPDNLRGIVATRLDGLDPDERAVLADAAVIGRRAPLDALEEMVSRLHRGIDFEAVVSRLVEAELLEVERRHWEFRSEVAREVAYRTLPKADRARRHGGIAAWIEERALQAAGLDDDYLPDDEIVAGIAAVDDGTVSRIGHHWAAAAELVAEMGPIAKVPDDAADRAVIWLSAAGRRAQRRDLLGAAARAYDRALDLLPESDTARRIRLLVSRARVRAERWELDDARADAEEALAGALAVADRSVEAAAITRLGDIDQRTGNLDAAVDRLRTAADRFATEGDDRGRGEALRLLGLTQVFASAPRAALASFAEAEGAFVAAGDVAGQGWVAQNMAWASLLMGELALTETEVERALDLFGRAGDQVGTSWATGLLAYVRFGQGRTGDAEALAGEILDVADGHGDRWAQAMMRSLVASIRLWEGAVDEALELATAATQAFRDLGDPWGLAMSRGTTGRALAMSGRVEEGFALTAEARSERPVHASREGDASDVALVALATQVGEPDRVESILDAAEAGEVAPLDPSERVVTFTLARLQRGEHPEPPAGTARAYARAVAAMVHAATGDAVAAVEAADAAIAAADATFLDRAMADSAAGLALVRTGRGDEGLARLDRARATVAATSDRLSPAMVALARAFASTALDAPDAVAERTEADLAVARLGLTAAGWESVFSRAVGVRPPTTVG